MQGSPESGEDGKDTPFEAFRGASYGSIPFRGFLKGGDKRA